ncbi:hypothetical protein LTR50_005332 [Elasticomyces elasticus]|nr:hypothetical protein LTR50_005332 [Elasticomyces elasticus]
MARLKSGQNLKRPASAELDHGDSAVNNVNTRTGRPIRNSAGKKSLDPHFVPSTDIATEPFKDGDAASDDSDEGVDDDTAYGESRAKKRRRTITPSPSPTEPPDSLLHVDDLPTRESTPFEDEQIASTNAIRTVSLTFNVPPGHTGAFIVNLDIAALSRNAPSHDRKIVTAETRASRPEALPEPSEPENSSKGGFLSLPAELRNEIYGLVFLVDHWFDMSHPEDFCRSSALLRTCRQVHAEGASVLYGDNHFFLCRQAHLRAPYWSPQWTEIGFKDVRLFLRSIGPTNISLMRYLTIMFEDAPPSVNPHLPTHDQRRFEQDEYLIQCLKMLAKHSRLQRFDLAFFGRRSYSASENRFQDYLTMIQADEVCIIGSPTAEKPPRAASWHSGSKIWNPTRDMLTRKMTRDRPVFNVPIRKALLSVHDDPTIRGRQA